MFLNHKKKQTGFTLLELLVVIGIIAVLATIGLTSYSTAQKKAREAQRKADLKQIQNALEQYYSICGYKYPTPNAQQKYTSVICQNPTTAIMQEAPKDPKTGDSYGCKSGSTCDSTQYTICATPEIENEICISNLQ